MSYDCLVHGPSGPPRYYYQSKTRFGPGGTRTSGPNNHRTKGKRKKGESVEKDHEEGGENGEVESANKEDKTSIENEEEKERIAIEKVKAVERSAIVAPQLNLQQMEAAIAKGGMGYDQV